MLDGMSQIASEFDEIKVHEISICLSSRSITKVFRNATLEQQ
jgi:hypothetical protein